MAKDWSYSLQSKISKEYGGPKQYAEKLINIGREKGKVEGIAEGKKRMIPVTVGLTLFAMTAVKVYDYLAYKKRETTIDGVEESDTDNNAE